ncbi:hypothetical protein N5912_02690 [Arcobacter lacus]|uniref:hypothetical protein n=1 Tax=Arcobacter lacus TaxID=1912876 RepID=UPI0021BAF5E6|nr:hypothetical protein [Arcobacter lacus]MCT7910727.1 hypothetical protein [Arcobacter lacus]
MDYDKYKFNVKGIIRINSPKGMKETLLQIEAINVLRGLNKDVESTVKGNKSLEELVKIIDGHIEILSHKIEQ